MNFVSTNKEMPEAERSHDKHKPILVYTTSGEFRVAHYVIYYLNEKFEIRHNEDGDITSKTYRWEDWHNASVIRGITKWAYLNKEMVYGNENSSCK